jgi:alpha-L-fucosidase 2
MSPPWGSKYTININTEMNYWPAEPTNLAETVDPLIAMIMDLTDTGARTAKEMYGARGWVVHHNTDLWRASAPIDGAPYGMWPTGGAWLTLHLWDHYDYSGDKAFLAKAYPAMKGAAQFFLDTLVEEPKHHWLVTNPSLSPENTHPQGAAVAPGPTMDMQILRDLFADSIRAGEILGVDADFRAQMAAARASCRNGWRTGTCRRRTCITAMFLICSASIPAGKSIGGIRRNWRQRHGDRWRFAAIRRRAGRQRGVSISGPVWAKAIMRSAF